MQVSERQTQANGVVAAEHVVGVSGGRAELPCHLHTSAPNDRAILALWYVQGRRLPVYSYDARGPKGLFQPDEVLEGRGKFDTTSNPARLLLDPVATSDQGLYTCRVDFLHSPTQNTVANLTVIEPPRNLTITNEAGMRVRHKIGPINEGSPLSLSCYVTGVACVGGNPFDPYAPLYTPAFYTPAYGPSYHPPPPPPIYKPKPANEPTYTPIYTPKSDSKPDYKPEYKPPSYRPKLDYKPTPSYKPKIDYKPDYTPAPSYKPEVTYKPVLHYKPEVEYDEDPKPYAFDYGVKDDYTGAHYGHKEKSDGQEVKGSYSVALPDGRIQTVKYKANHEQGFQAEVSYEGDPIYP
ncbi:hypothetical protein O3P69_009347 [Scylla paramamosain]|uniref:Ig-like domain-containing protein n=1 Tax=Scylla paramamosain TaxID=85552 RepID=A0AAW0TDC4_SCYPA